jgi:hypothetical protein
LDLVCNSTSSVSAPGFKGSCRTYSSSIASPRSQSCGGAGSGSTGSSSSGGAGPSSSSGGGGSAKHYGAWYLKTRDWDYVNSSVQRGSTW